MGSQEPKRHTKPILRRGIEAVDAVAAPVLEGAVHNDAVLAAYSLITRGRTELRRRTERVSRRILHGLNVPAASDVNRVLAQLAQVENHVRALRNEMTDVLTAREDRASDESST
jgi:hypothetical protein